VVKKFILLVLLLGTQPAFAELYKCSVADKTTYQDKPCPTVETQVIIPSQPDTPPQSTSEVPADTTATPPAAANNAPVVERDADGRIKRSEKAKHDFKAENPCPATGKRTGACPGYVIDHIQALVCGGADSPANMQWQTVAEGKAKDAWERDGCKPSKNATPSQTPELTPLPESTTPPVIRIGTRGGRYVIGKNGKKRYLPRRR
jgi:hypothetical protein